jgi:hypothetical protein
VAQGRCGAAGLHGCRNRAVEVSSVGVSGIVIIIGSALFLCAAFAPISFRVFPAKSATRKREAIRASPTSWSVTQILFGLGGLVTAIGVGLFAYLLPSQRADCPVGRCWRTSC